MVFRVVVGKDGSYSFFSGRDASRAYLTGKFQDDLNDDVEDFTDEQFHGLMHWKDFYLKVPSSWCTSAAMKRT